MVWQVVVLSVLINGLQAQLDMCSNSTSQRSQEVLFQELPIQGNCSCRLVAEEDFYIRLKKLHWTENPRAENKSTDTNLTITLDAETLNLLELYDDEEGSYCLMSASNESLPLMPKDCRIKRTITTNFTMQTQFSGVGEGTLYLDIAGAGNVTIMCQESMETNITTNNQTTELDQETTGNAIEPAIMLTSEINNSTGANVTTSTQKTSIITSPSYNVSDARNHKSAAVLFPMGVAMLVGGVFLLIIGLVLILLAHRQNISSKLKKQQKSSSTRRNETGNIVFYDEVNEDLTINDARVSKAPGCQYVAQPHEENKTNFMKPEQPPNGAATYSLATADGRDGLQVVTLGQADTADRRTVSSSNGTNQHFFESGTEEGDYSHTETYQGCGLRTSENLYQKTQQTENDDQDEDLYDHARLCPNVSTRNDSTYDQTTVAEKQNNGKRQQSQSVEQTDKNQSKSQSKQNKILPSKDNSQDSDYNNPNQLPCSNQCIDRQESLNPTEAVSGPEEIYSNCSSLGVNPQEGRQVLPTPGNATERKCDDEDEIYVNQKSASEMSLSNDSIFLPSSLAKEDSESENDHDTERSRHKKSSIYINQCIRKQKDEKDSMTQEHDISNASHGSISVSTPGGIAEHSSTESETSETTEQCNVNSITSSTAPLLNSGDDDEEIYTNYMMQTYSLFPQGKKIKPKPRQRQTRKKVNYNTSKSVEEDVSEQKGKETRSHSEGNTSINLPTSVFIKSTGFQSDETSSQNSDFDDEDKSTMPKQAQDMETSTSGLGSDATLPLQCRPKVEHNYDEIEVDESGPHVDGTRTGQCTLNSQNEEEEMIMIKNELYESFNPGGIQVLSDPVAREFREKFAHQTSAPRDAGHLSQRL